MGLILKTKITEQQAQDAAISADTAAKFLDLSDKIQAEKSDRELADVQLQNAILTEKNLREAADTNLQTNLDNETAARISADARLQQNINSENLTRVAAVETLTNSLGDERTARITADSGLDNKIDDEISNRTLVTSNLQNSLTTETADRKSADTTLQNQIDAEIQNRQTAISDMQAAIMVSLGDSQALQNIENENLKSQIQAQAQSQSTAIYGLQSKLDTEILNRQNADTAFQADLNSNVETLNSKIETEKTARENADIAIRNEINSEVQKVTAAVQSETNLREAAINELATEINSETTAIKISLQNETNTRATAISNLRADLNSEVAVLNAAINAETINRTQAINDMQAAIMVSLGDNQALQDIENERLRAQIQSQTSISSASISGLQTQISDEAQTRATEDSKLSAAIQTEKTARENAVTSLQSSLTSTINTKSTETLNNAKSYADTKFAGVADSLNDFTAPTATANGTHGLVPAPPKGTTLQYLTSLGWKALDDASVQIANTPNQANTLTYSGSSQSPTWANFDSSKMSLSGTTSGTAANSYTATFTPTGIYVWADTKNQESRNVTWTIQPLLLPKPTAAVTSFTYDGNTKTLTISNYNSTYMNQSGALSATNVNSYNVSYTLKNTTNTKWADSTTAKVSIDWQITAASLTAAQSSGFAQAATLTYNGNYQSVTISNYDSSVHRLSGTTSALHAGTYTATIAPQTGLTWYDGTNSAKSITWTIDKLKIAKPVAETTNFYYSGSEVTLSVSNYVGGQMTQSGTVKATAAGNYSVVYKLKDDYIWNDNSSADVTINWKISVITVNKPTIAGSSTFIYSGKYQSLNVSGWYLGQDSVTFSLSSNIEEEGDPNSTIYGWYIKDIGNYTVTFALKDKTNYVWKDNTTADVALTWTITPNYLAKPVGVVTNFLYTGKSQSPTIENYNATFMTQSGDTSGTEVDNYSISYTLKDTTNTKWEDSSTGVVTVDWVITSNALIKPTLTNASKTYTGSSQSPTIKNFNANYMTKSGTESATTAGTYSITISLKDKDTYTWSGGGTDDIVLTWTIAKKSLTKPTLSNSTLTYNGESQSPTVNNFDSATMSQTGTASATNAGNYTLTVKLRNTTNYCWADSTTANVALSWSIAKLEVVEPTLVNSSYDYTGSTIEAAVKNLDLNQTYYTISGDRSAKTVGSYTITFTLKSTTSTIWKTAQNTTAKTLTWQIVAAKLSTELSTFEFTGDLTFTIKYGLAYPNNRQTVNFGFNNYIDGYNMVYHILSGTYYSSSAGTFDTIIKPKSNYVWSDGSSDAKTVTCTIKQREVSLPQLAASTFTYDGTAKTISVTNEDYLYFIENSNSVSSATNAGTYSAVFKLYDANSSYWSDNTTANKTLTWTIAKKELAVPVASATYFAQDGNTKTVTFDGYDSTTMTMSGTTSASSVGSYNVTFGLKDTANYKWAGTTETTITVSWEIGGASIPVPTVKSLTPEWGTIASGSDAPNVAGTFGGGGYVLCGIVLNSFNSDLMTGTIIPPGAYPTNHSTAIATGGTGHIVYTYNNTSTTFRIKFVLKDKTNYKWADNTVSDKTITCTFPTFVISPTISNMTPQALTYDGAEKTWSYFFSNIFSASATTTADIFKETHEQQGSAAYKKIGTNAGSYSLTLTPIKNVTWYDGTNSAKTFTLTINKATPTITVTDSSGASFTQDQISAMPLKDFYLFRTSSSVTFTVTTNSDGEIYASKMLYTAPSDPFTLAVNQSSKTVTVTAKSGAAKEYDVYIICTKPTTNFTGGSTNNEGFRFNFYNRTSIDSISWSEIAAAARRGDIDVGEMKSITLTGTFGGVDFDSDSSYKALLLGVDHNQAVEGTGAHFAIVKSISSGTVKVISPASAGSGTSTTAAFTQQYNLANYNATLANDTGFVNHIADTSLRSLIKSQKKYHNTTAETSRFFWLSYFETSGIAYNITTYKFDESTNYQAQYDYFANGNKWSKIVKLQSSTTTCSYWLRNHETSSTEGEHFGIGGANATVARERDGLKFYAVIPCFVVSG